MSRLQNKCLLASVATHALLLLILFVGPAFLVSHQPVDDLPVLEVIPAKLVDEKVSGGGSPEAKPPAPAPAPKEPMAKPPTPEPVKQPAPEPVKVKAVAPEPARREPIVKEERISKDSLEPVERRTARPPNPHKVEIDKDELVPRKAGARPKKPVTDDAAEAQARENERALATRRLAMNNVLHSLKEGLSSATTVEMPGPGGEAYANYAQTVKSVYEQAWIAPVDVSDDNGITRASVTLARDGSVIDAHIIGMSGNAPVDRSVDRTLERVRFVAPFPDGAKESRRTFTISFNLKAKRLLG